MFPIIALLAAAPPPPLPPASEARTVIDWQLRAPPRTGSEAALSPEEAAAIQQRYLQSIGQRPEKAQDRPDQ